VTPVQLKMLRNSCFGKVQVTVKVIIYGSIYKYLNPSNCYPLAKYFYEKWCSRNGTHEAKKYGEKSQVFFEFEK
jgi:hypothetical protein